MVASRAVYCACRRAWVAASCVFIVSWSFWFDVMLDWIAAVWPGKVPPVLSSESAQFENTAPKPLFDAFVVSTLESALVSSGRLVRALLKVVLLSWSDPSVCSWIPRELKVANVEEAPVTCEIRLCIWFWMLVAVLSPCRGAAVFVVGSYFVSVARKVFRALKAETKAVTSLWIAVVLGVTLIVTGCVVVWPRLKVTPPMTLDSVLLLDATEMPLIVACAFAAAWASFIFPALFCGS